MQAGFVANGPARYEAAFDASGPSPREAAIEKAVEAAFQPRLAKAGWLGRWLLRFAIEFEIGRRIVRAPRVGQSTPSPYALW